MYNINKNDMLVIKGGMSGRYIRGIWRVLNYQSNSRFATITNGKIGYQVDLDSVIFDILPNKITYDVKVGNKVKYLGYGDGLVNDAEYVIKGIERIDDMVLLVVEKENGELSYNNANYFGPVEDETNNGVDEELVALFVLLMKSYKTKNFTAEHLIVGKLLKKFGLYE